MASVLILNKLHFLIIYLRDFIIQFFGSNVTNKPSEYGEKNDTIKNNIFNFKCKIRKEM